jgi:hypothetical protein
MKRQVYTVVTATLCIVGLHLHGAAGAGDAGSGLRAPSTRTASPPIEAVSQLSTRPPITPPNPSRNERTKDTGRSPVHGTQKFSLCTGLNGGCRKYFWPGCCPGLQCRNVHGLPVSRLVGRCQP